MKKINKKQITTILICTVTIIFILGILIWTNILNNIANKEHNSSNSGSSNANILPEYIKKGVTLLGVTGTLVDLDTSDATATAMDITYGKTAYVNGKKIEGLFVPRENLKVGDYVSYTPDTSEAYPLPTTVSGYINNQSIEQDRSLLWQILSVNNDGTVDLISSKPTNTNVFFEGALGYNNRVYILNDICDKQYGNKSLDVKARCIKSEDIESNMNQAGIEAKEQYSNEDNVVKYGETRKYTINRYYPILYSQENGSGINTTTIKKDGIGLSDSYYSSPTSETSAQAGNNGITVTQTHYAMTNSSENINYFDDKAFYELIFGTNLDYRYWLATRYANCFSDNASFGGRDIYDGGIGGRYFINSFNDTYSYGRCLRPIVTLKADIQIYGGDGSKEHPYKLNAQK